MNTADQRRFGGISRLFGTEGFNALGDAHVIVVGVGGVGSWAAEALARTAVGHITLIDADTVEQSNTNRQLQSMVQQQVDELQPYQVAKVVLRGIYDSEVYPDTEAIKEIDSVAAVEVLCKPNYDFEKLKKEYENQIIGNFIKEIEAMPQSEVTRRALYLGIDALMGNSHVY